MCVQRENLWGESRESGTSLTRKSDLIMDRKIFADQGDIEVLCLNEEDYNKQITINSTRIQSCVGES